MATDKSQHCFVYIDPLGNFIRMQPPLNGRARRARTALFECRAVDHRFRSIVPPRESAGTQELRVASAG